MCVFTAPRKLLRLYNRLQVHESHLSPPSPPSIVASKGLDCTPRPWWFGNTNHHALSAVSVMRRRI